MDSTTSEVPPAEMSVRDLSFPLFQAKGWMRFLGVMSIIEGIADALSLIGIVVAWLPIWMGVLLFQAANEIEEGRQGGGANSVRNAHAKLKTYFVLRGITILVEVALFVLALTLFGTLGILGALENL